MALINDTYFLTGLKAIPNLRGSVLSSLDTYMSIYEPEYLDAVLGIDLKNDFEAGLLEPVIDSKWLALRDGSEFEYQGIKYKWVGFNNTLKESPIAYYVFWKFMSDKNFLFTGAGVVISDSENSNRVSPINHLVTVWCRMANDNRILEKFILSNESDYSNYAPTNTLTKKSNIYGI
ncbi:MAG: hypothetical protein GY928_14765 [Colwellia sp.]|nr:hypothetical protein [Colwellia sp.]